MMLRKIAVTLLALMVSSQVAVAANADFVFPRTVWENMMRSAAAWLARGKPPMTGAAIYRATVYHTFKVRSSDNVVVRIAVNKNKYFIVLRADGTQVRGTWQIVGDKLCFSGGGYTGRGCSRMVKTTWGWVLYDTAIGMIRV